VHQIDPVLSKLPREYTLLDTECVNQTYPDFPMFSSSYRFRNSQCLLGFRIFPRFTVSLRKVFVYRLITPRKLLVRFRCENGFRQGWMETGTFLAQEIDGIRMPGTVLSVIVLPLWS
jgi:hypothetical protein